jgi:hypothetical protein
MSTTDPLDQLRKLAALRDEGVIDAAEFDRLKAQLLAQVGGAGGAGSADERVHRVLDASAAVDAAFAPPGDSDRVTQAQVDESEKHVATLQQQFDHIASVHRNLAARAASIHRRVRHFAFLLRSRRAYRNFAFGRFAPLIVAAGVGMVLGCVVVGIFPVPTIVVLAGGFLTAGATVLATLHVLVYPRDDHVSERLTIEQPQLAELQSQVAQSEAEVAVAQKSLDEAKQKHAELLKQFNSRRNELLSFDWRDLRGVPFEKFVRAIFEELGYQVREAKTTGDKTVNLIAEKAGVAIAIAAKGCAESVENSAVQKAHAGMTQHKCQRCAIVTNSTFTPSAIDLAKRLGCTLVDKGQIQPLILGQIRL